ncbi:enoyl-CoA hydratase/isomerase family protein [Saccharopolyspora terrae]|uniref:Enoyl-CoA hydratase/isomerase family protein n=1 Tax=Saccharopolyspora terrae TaxID=2530384 RepID=A0A4R4VBW3_9PSEU|nr:enoyl-CoA hydratase/isomerase family protein [Saccharopolyspora terrae]
MTGDEILLTDEPRPGIVRLTLNRPERLNALTPVLLDRLAEELDRLEHESSARVVVLTGSGRGFCAGFDLDEMAATWTQGLPDLLASQEGWVAAVERMVGLTMPVIAAVDGPAVGAGMSLAMAADLRVATPRARFGAAFVRVGLSGADLGLS